MPQDIESIRNQMKFEKPYVTVGDIEALCDEIEYLRKENRELTNKFWDRKPKPVAVIKEK